MEPTPWIACGGKNPGVFRLDAEVEGVQWIGANDGSKALGAYRLAVADDPIRFAVASKDGKISVHDADGIAVGQFVHAVQGSAVAVTSLTFAGDGSLISAGSDGELRVYDMPSGIQSATIRAPSPVYGLAAPAHGRLAGIARTPEGDRLHLWDLARRQLIYQGPIFKIASFYLTVAVATEAISGRLAHGDREGRLHVYTPSEDVEYEHVTATTDHGDFCAVAFLDDTLVTAGQQRPGLACWSVEPLVRGNSVSLSVPVSWACRWDESSLLAVSKDGRMQRVVVRSEEVRASGVGTLSDVRDVVGPSGAQLAREALRRKRTAAASLVADVQALLIRDDYDAAEAQILELEKLGFESEALQLFAEMYRGQRNLLGELRALFTIVTEIPPQQVPVEVLDRAAFMFEAVHEPELAALVLAHMAGVADEDEWAQRIARLAPRFVTRPDDSARVAVAGLPDLGHEPQKTKTAIVLEIQKSEALRRFFDDDVVLQQSRAEEVKGVVAVDELRDALVADAAAAELIGGTVITPVLWKRGKHVASSKRVLQIVAPGGRGLDGIAFWLLLEARPPGMRLTTFGVYQPGAPDGRSDWNHRVSDDIVRHVQDGRVLEWLSKVDFLVTGALASTIRHAARSGSVS